LPERIRRREFFDDLSFGGLKLSIGNKSNPAQRIGGIAGWLLRRLRRTNGTGQRLELVERIALAPRQSLALIEAEGRRILVATSADGAPAFFPLDERRQCAGRMREQQRPGVSR
jgi:hypothetical protein